MSQALSKLDDRPAALHGVDDQEQGRRTRYRVSGMDCASCAAKIDAALRRLPGVSEVGVSAPAGSVTVSHAGALSPSKIASQVITLGYQVTASEDVTFPARKGTTERDHRSSDHAEHRAGADDEPPAGLHGQLHEHGASEGPWWKSSRGLLTIGCGVALVLAYVILESSLLRPSAGHFS